MTVQQGEEWRPCLGGLYAVSSLGRLRRELPEKGTWPGRILRRSRTKKGYWAVRLWLDGKLRNILVHRLVATVFVEPCPVGHEANHIDGDTGNRAASNLEWVTRSQNIRHAFGLGRMRWGGRLPPHVPGEKNGRAKLTDARVRDLRVRHAAGTGTRELCREFGIGKSEVWYIVARKHWRHVV